MSALEIAQSPPIRWPGRFLASGPLWGIFAGVLLAALGPLPWESRWHPGVLSLTHTLLLGVIGNTCLGAALQFLSAAAGSRPAGGAGTWATLHALYNIGVFALSTGLLLMEPWLLMIAASLLAIAIPGAVLAMCIGLWRGRGDRLLRGTLAIPLLFWCVAAGLGIALAIGLAGYWPLSFVAVADAHAIAGIAGTFGLLLIAAGRIVLPTLLGSARPKPRLFFHAFLGLTLLIVAAMHLRMFADDAAPQVRMVAAAMAIATAVGLLALWRRVRGRNRPMATAWMLGLGIAHIAAWILAADPRRMGMAPMVSMLGFALPLLILSVSLEISAFLAWIDLHLRAGRGVHVPGVHLLMPDCGKWHWLAAQCAAGTLLVLLALYPSQILASLAGIASAVCYALQAWVRGQPRRNVLRFLHRSGDRPCRT